MNSLRQTTGGIWMIYQLASLAFLALGLLTNLYLFVTLKGEMQRYFRRRRKEIDLLTARVDALHGSRESPPADADEGRPAAERPPMGLSPRAGFNLSKRAQALRLLRRGEDAAHIAAALVVPRNEIELLIRVERIAAGAALKATAGSR